MPYAFEGGISTDEVENSIYITEEQYMEGLNAILSGKAVSIVGGFHIVDPSEVGGGETPPDEPTMKDYEDAIQELVDAVVRTQFFRDGVTLASYVTSTNPIWAAQAQAFVAWRDRVWAYAYQQLALVQSGQRPQPSVTDFLAEIEPIEWPSFGPGELPDETNG